jgi:hypothetical protein
MGKIQRADARDRARREGSPTPSDKPVPPAGERQLARSRRSWVRQPGAIKGRLSCGVCSSSRIEQWKSGEDLLQVHHLTRYELSDGESDDLGRTVDVGDHAARFRIGEAPRSAPRPSWISSASIVSTSKWMATFVAPVVSSQSSSGALSTAACQG